MAIDAVKRAGYAAAVPTLAAMVNDGRYTFRFNAATAMKTLSGLRGASGTAHHFASSDPRVREAACEMVAMFDEGAKLLRPHVEKALLDEDAKVAAAAKKALLVLDKRG